MPKSSITRLGLALALLCLPAAATLSAAACSSSDTPSPQPSGAGGAAGAGADAAAGSGGDTGVGLDAAQEANAKADCYNHVRDGEESDVDCGGSCDRCLGGQKCSTPGDCASAVCTAGSCVGGEICFDPCQDKAKDGDETDIDCGGAVCGGCQQDQGCKTKSDCLNFVGMTCAAGKCYDPCQDKVKNGDETDIDCGGAVCGGCQQGQGCNAKSDCLNFVGMTCAAGKCYDPCQDKVKNGDETDVDCGGGECGGCQQGQGCNAKSDCLIFVGMTCTAGKCNDPCQDKVKNGDETDIDCGGAVCGGCQEDQGCNTKSDCLNFVGMTCTAGKCYDPCQDKVKNGDETDVDCGGSICGGCSEGEGCKTKADCLNFVGMTCTAHK